MEHAILIVGLGNPGVSYERTRHNLGFIVVRKLATGLGLTFKKVAKFEAELAVGSIEGRAEKLVLLLPMTYMNLSGRAVKKVVEYYKVSFSLPNCFLVVVDDVYTNFNLMRLRAQGSSGGHNGLKSLEEHLQSNEFARLRMGIGPQEERVFLEDYVLGKFTDMEQNGLPDFVARGAQVIECCRKRDRRNVIPHTNKPCTRTC